MSMLELVKEAKIHSLLPANSKKRRLEASGVLTHDGHVIIIFDNLTQIARIEASLAPSAANSMLGDDRGRSGHEDIAYNARQERFYVLIEAVQVSEDIYQAELVEYDLDFVPRERRRLPTEFETDNKGFEGLSCIHRDGRDYLLALCEGNSCKGGEVGRRPGNGRIQIFQKAAPGWEHVDELRLPESVQFTDYSSLDIKDGRVAVLSQTSAMVWLGALDPVAWRFADEGVMYHLPRGAPGKTPYCTPEGITWIAPDRLAVVSDRRKKGSSKRCQTTDESLHVFRVV